MSLHRSKATLIGLLEAGRANEWVVTEKLGNALKMKSASKANKRQFMKQLMRIWDRYGTKMDSSSCWYFSCVLQLTFVTYDSGYTLRSSVLEHFCSPADAMILHMGRTISSYTSCFSQWLSLLSVSATSAPLSHSHNRSMVRLSGLRFHSVLGQVS
jgi:hypothetical protein